jgi:K+-sensing histidine kinase KdpD
MPDDSNSVRRWWAAAAHPGARVVVVVVLQMIALATTIVLSGLDTRLPYIAFLPALVLCCDLYGLKIALAVTAASTILTWYAFVDPVMTFDLPSIGDTVQLVCFVIVTVFVCWVVSIYRTEIARLQRSKASDSRR